MPAPILVAFVAYEGVSLLDLSGPMEALDLTSSYSDFANAEHPYECLVVSASGGPVRTSEGVRLVTEPIAALNNRPVDTLVVPGAPNVDDVTRDEALIAWLRQRAHECRRVCSVCAGAFALAKAGLLDGRRAATHWMQCGLLSAQYPNVTVEPDAIFVRDGGVWTSAGVTTGIDLALALIEEDFGRPAAMHVARVLVVYLRRAGGQSQYSALLAGQTESETDRFGDLEHWIAGHLTGDLSVERLAERMHMSPRNFARAYAADRKRTPAKAVEAIRVDAARRALEHTSDRIELVARRCGFSDEEQMRSAFMRQLGVSPRSYRERFPGKIARPPRHAVSWRIEAGRAPGRLN